jgi:hypothetical protein
LKSNIGCPAKNAGFVGIFILLNEEGVYSDLIC